MTRKIAVEWYATEHFRAEVEVDDDFDINHEDADERLDGIICDMDQPELTKAFEMCSEREITSKKEVAQ